ncbi:MAG: MarR family transcriptional regulator [Rhodopseudomonas sp.]|nr:MarR family transcriptional regulator [Rhodopseudomonas sp.]
MNADPAPQALLPLIVADIYELAGALRARGETVAATVGQTQARWQVMSAASGGRHTVPQIARRLGVSRQNVQRIADLLVAEGSATFETNPDHRGSPYLVLSKDGSAALARITRAAAADHAAIADQLGNADLKALHRALRRLIEATATIA